MLLSLLGTKVRKESSTLGMEVLGYERSSYHLDQSLSWNCWLAHIVSYF